MEGNLNICNKCEEPGKLVMCDGCPRSYHRNCFRSEIDMNKEFHCGRCSKPILERKLEKSRLIENVSKYSENLKRGTQTYYEENYEQFKMNARFRTYSRAASASSSNRNTLKGEQDSICRGLLLPNMRYRPCGFRATECDHIIELRHGGKDIIDNLQMLCGMCHNEKTAKNYRGQLCY